MSYWTVPHIATHTRYCVSTISYMPFNERIILCTDCKAAVSVVSPEYDVEENDRHSLEKAMKNAVRNKKQDPCMLMKDLYLNTYVCVAGILEHGVQQSRDMVRAAQTAIELGLAEGEAEGLTPILTVAELLKKLHISIKWDNTTLLEKMVGRLPKEARTLAMSLLVRYNLYLDVYDDVATVRDSLTKVEAAPEVTEAQLPVEVTVAKDVTEFTGKDCKEMLDLLLRKSWKIPRNKIMVNEARSGDSTTVVFIIDKAFIQSIIQYSEEGRVLWAFQELSVTRVRIGVFEVNVSHLLTQHFKEALRSGLTGNMDFMGATKVCS